MEKMTQNTATAALPWYIHSTELLYCIIITPSQIGSNWAVTAAHCLMDFDDDEEPIETDIVEEAYDTDLIPASRLSLLLGVHDRSLQTELTQQKVSVSKVLIHKDYNGTSHENDIALLKLGERVDLFTFPPACLPGQNDSFTGRNGSVYGGSLALATALSRMGRG
jgi:secreted trypsin-like serine protease